MMAPGEARRIPTCCGASTARVKRRLLQITIQVSPPRIHHEFIAMVHCEDVVKLRECSYKSLIRKERRKMTERRRTALMWINHFDLLPGDPSVFTSFNAISSGVGGGLTGLVIQSNTTGEIAQGGGNKVVHMGLQVPPNYTIRRVRVCYELSNSRSFISQIMLAQVADPPDHATVILDDGTDLTDPGPVCVASADTSVDPSLGAVHLSLRVNFGSTSDRIVIRALGLGLRRV
jgi:hypothetical protein